jgi:hypothetical protein
LKAFKEQYMRESKARRVAAIADSQLREAIDGALTIVRSTRLRQIMNLRDKHLAHSLSKTRREAKGPVSPMKYGDETDLLNESIPIIENLYRWLHGDFSVDESRQIDRSYAEALWHGCTLKVSR